MLLDHLGLSWSGYLKVRKGVKKRLVRHMQQLKCYDMVAYLDLIDRDPDIRKEAGYLMAVSISRFFRDRQLWDALEKEFLPEFISRKRKEIRIWSAGCACGEEVYSIKIVCEHLKKRLKPTPSFRILATDFNPQYLNKAKAGIYASSSLKEVTTDEKERFFKKKAGKNHYQVIPEIKGVICWKIHDLFQEPPDGNFHVIFLRNNLLTYHQEPVKTALFMQVISTLTTYGLLIIGSHETLPHTMVNLSPVQGFAYVFRKA